MQIQANIQDHARVVMHTEHLSDDELRSVHLEQTRDITATVAAEGSDASRLRPPRRPADDRVRGVSRDDWTLAGVFEVAPGIHRIVCPLPGDGLKAVNVYAIEDGDGLALSTRAGAATRSSPRSPTASRRSARG